MRLAKYLAHAGVASRRASEELIRAGRVHVAGEVVTDPARDVSGDEPVTFDGERVTPTAEPVVFALHKPAGVVSTASDPQGRRTVVSLVAGRAAAVPRRPPRHRHHRPDPPHRRRRARARLTHPRYEVPRTYRVTVGRPPVHDRTLRRLRAGVELEDGPTAPARVRRLAPDTLEITIHEGRKRQVRRMCEAVGHPVVRLARTSIGPLVLGDLRSGAHRRLSSEEVAALRRSGRSAPAPSGIRQARNYSS